MDITAVKDFMYIISAVLAVLAMIYTWITSRSKANSVALSDLEKRLTITETEIKHLSGIGDEIKTVHNRVDQVATTTANIDGQLKQVNNTLTLIQQHLMAQGSE